MKTSEAGNLKASDHIINDDSENEYVVELVVIPDGNLEKILVGIKRIKDGVTFKIDAESLKKYSLKTGKKKKKKEDVGLGNVVIPNERYVFSNMVIYPETTQSIRAGISKIMMRDRIEAAWHISRIDPSNRTVMNFYGPSGVGKTMAAFCIAREIGKPLYQASYADVKSPIVNQTIQNIKQIFQEAKKKEAILFFDEADAIVHKRSKNIEGPNACVETAGNQNKIAFMQELDRFTGIVIMTTNLFENFDEAMVRRVAQHVCFKKPNRSMRIEIFKLHIPNADRVDPGVNWECIGDLTKGMSGGDILNIVLNSINVVCLKQDESDWVLTQSILECEIKNVRAAKEAHSGKLVRESRLCRPSVPVIEHPLADAGLPNETEGK
jgi:SpoVK/Ycf46/Vps4 family AAA+-type ATPase